MKQHPLYIIALLFFFGSCQKETLMTYEDESNIYFSGFMNGVYVNEQTRGFGMTFGNPQLDSVIVPVTIMGPLSDEPRPYKVVIDEALTTGIKDKHYIMPADSDFVIPAGKVTDNFKIKIIRDMYEDSVKIVFRLMPNEHFKTNMPDFNNPVKPVNLLNFTIKASDVLPKPDWWDKMGAYFGNFTRLKLETYVRALNFSYNNIYSGNYTDSQLITFARNFQQWLNNQRNNGNTILEADGSPMVMGPDSQ